MLLSTGCVLCWTDALYFFSTLIFLYFWVDMPWIDLHFSDVRFCSILTLILIPFWTTRCIFSLQSIPLPSLSLLQPLSVGKLHLLSCCSLQIYQTPHPVYLPVIPQVFLSTCPFILALNQLQRKRSEAVLKRLRCQVNNLEMERRQRRLQMQQLEGEAEELRKMLQAADE